MTKLIIVYARYLLIVVYARKDYYEILKQHVDLRNGAISRK